jgi:polyhydroxyalkanoate synthesis regulator phasin
VVIVFLVVAFKFTRDPKESTEFKNLLQKRTELLAKKTDLESKTADVIKLQSYVNDYTERIDAWKRRINDVNSLGISE